jgi:hypothetical protein
MEKVLDGGSVRVTARVKNRSDLVNHIDAGTGAVQDASNDAE